MNIRKITHNRRRQQIGNLVTGVLNHFGKSTEQNLTETVLNYSTQPREYVEFAVRRTLNCGVGQGFLVRTGHNTFDVPRLLCETDSGKAKKSKNVKPGSAQAKKSQDVEPGSGQYKEYDRKTFEERYTACYRKHNIKPQNCRGRNIVTNRNCRQKTDEDQNYCKFHMHLGNVYTYAIHFVKNIHKPDTKKCLEKHYADYKDLEKVLTYEGVSVYQQRLVDFLTNIYKYYVLGHVGPHMKKMYEMFSDPVTIPSGLQCNGKQITPGNYGSQCEKAAKFMNTCDEHSFYVQMLRGFCREPEYYGTKSDGKPIVPAKSFAEGVITTTLLPRIEGKGILFDLTRTIKCAYLSFATITRYHRLRLTGTRYKEGYYDSVLGNIQHVNKLGYESQTAGNCFCLNLPAVFRKFGQNEPWPEGSDYEENPPQGNPPQGNPPQGNPPQGNPPQGNPPQGNPPQGNPPPL